MKRITNKVLVSTVVLTALATTACESSPAKVSRTKVATATTAPTPVSFGQVVFRADMECGTYAGTGCAPTTARVDVTPPVFSHPTRITNPLFPIGALESAVLLGTVDGKPFRSETTLLPQTETVLLDTGPVEVRLSQYTAYLDGRITEVAVDRYAQADDGAVWYLGEDVFDYEDGTITVSEGTWLAGRDGPPAMIMSATPTVGQVFRPEDIPGIVFEEVTVKKVGQVVDGPLGKVEGAIVAEELHLDGSRSQKVFAPRYGEFLSASDGDVEALALAVPTDRVAGAEPAALAQLVSGVWGLVESARLEDWEAVDATLTRLTVSGKALGAAAAPALIAKALDAAIAVLGKAVAGRKTGPVAAAAVEVAQSGLDLELRYRPVTVVDVGRFHLHAQQLRIDAAGDDAAGVAAEVATLEWIRDRVTGALTAAELRTIDDGLARLRILAGSGALPAAADEAARLAAVLRRLS